VRIPCRCARRSLRRAPRRRAGPRRSSWLQRRWLEQRASPEAYAAPLCACAAPPPPPPPVARSGALHSPACVRASERCSAAELVAPTDAIDAVGTSEQQEGCIRKLAPEARAGSSRRAAASRGCCVRAGRVQQLRQLAG
jgi:hypothetical protein